MKDRLLIAFVLLSAILINTFPVFAQQAAATDILPSATESAAARRTLRDAVYADWRTIVMAYPHLAAGNEEIPQERQVVLVPSRHYQTIQSAIGAAPIIFVRRGHYVENLTIYSGDVTIIGQQYGQVFLKGHPTADTVYARPGAGLVTLKNLNITDTQPLAYYDTGAVFGWFTRGFKIDHCNINARSIGVSAHYSYEVTITNSAFVGLADNSIGVYVALQEHLGTNTGDRLINNSFKRFATAIYNYELYDIDDLYRSGNTTILVPEGREYIFIDHDPLSDPLS